MRKMPRNISFSTMIWKRQQKSGFGNFKVENQSLMEKSKLSCHFQPFKALMNKMLRANPLVMSDFGSDSSKIEVQHKNNFSDRI